MYQAHILLLFGESNCNLNWYDLTDVDSIPGYFGESALHTVAW